MSPSPGTSRERAPRSGAPELVPGLVLALGYGALAMRSRASEGATLLDLLLATTLFCVVLAWLAAPGRPNRGALSTRRILAFSLLFHALGLLGAPILEDDPARYALDGWVFAEFGSPYGRAPETFFDADVPPEIEVLLDEVNHPEIPTIYGPTLAWLFRASHALAGPTLWPLRSMVAVASLAMLALAARRAPPLALLFVAWHPLVVKEFAFTGHPDVIAVALLLAAEALRGRRAIVVGVLAGLAVGAKLFALLALPWLLARSRRAALACAATLVALYGPFVSTMLPDPAAPSPHLSMGFDWLFNAPIHLALQPWLGGLGVRALVGLAFGACALHLWRTTRPGPDGTNDIPGDRLFGAMLLALPVLNPWYVIWPLAWWTRRPKAGLAAASIAVLAAYAQGLQLGRTDLAAYELPWGIVVFECGFVALAIGWDRRQARRSAGA